MPKAKATRSTQAAAPAPYNHQQAKEASTAQAGKKQEKQDLAKISADYKRERFGKLFLPRPHKYGIGNRQKPRDLTHFVKWPVYVRIQRQRRVLQHRLKVPPAINQFTNTVSKNCARRIFALADKYKPETRQEKKNRLLEFAKKKLEDETLVMPPPPAVLKYGINHITSLVEQKEARLVLIAHDVDPIEIVVWLPALCRRMGVPYAIVKGKARLGQLVDKKTATAVAFKKIKDEDSHEFAAIVDVVNEQYIGEKADKERRRWGGGKLGYKAAPVKAAKAIKDKARSKIMNEKRKKERADQEARAAANKAAKEPKPAPTKAKIAVVAPLPAKKPQKK